MNIAISSHNGNSGGGRAKPPKDTQFKRGRSGNPAGRPKGSKNLATLISKAAYDKIEVSTKGGGKRKLSRIEIATLNMATAAAKGDMKALHSLLNWVDTIEQRAVARGPEMSIGEPDLAVLNAIHERMHRYVVPKEISNEAQS